VLLASLIHCCEYKLARPNVDIAGLKCNEPVSRSLIEGGGPKVGINWTHYMMNETGV